MCNLILMDVWSVTAPCGVYMFLLKQIIFYDEFIWKHLFWKDIRHIATHSKKKMSHLSFGLLQYVIS